jgi:dTMP kinase
MGIFFWSEQEKMCYLIFSRLDKNSGTSDLSLAAPKQHNQACEAPMNAQSGLDRGRLIALEGLDGVGKTTQARLLGQHLARLGLPVTLTREPTNGPFGQKIRQILIHGRQGVAPAAELDLFIADRREHVQNVIQPALAAGKTIIADRYYFSSMAYQGALGLDPGDIQRRHVGFAPPPDLIIILEVPLTEVSRRLLHRSQQPRQSFEKIDYLAKVAAIFDQLVSPGLVRVNGLGSEEEVQARILAQVAQVMKLPSAPEQPAKTIALEVA